MITYCAIRSALSTSQQKEALTWETLQHCKALVEPTRATAGQNLLDELNHYRNLLQNEAVRQDILSQLFLDIVHATLQL